MGPVPSVHEDPQPLETMLGRLARELGWVCVVSDLVFGRMLM
jgi:hypothetical protein